MVLVSHEVRPFPHSLPYAVALRLLTLLLLGTCRDDGGVLTGVSTQSSASNRAVAGTIGAEQASTLGGGLLEENRWVALRLIGCTSDS